MAEGHGDPVFVSATLLPHHEDRPLARHTDHEVHTERHRNTKDYVTDDHSPQTNRRNTGILLRRLSDDFNVRKFPDLIEVAKKKRRAHSESEIDPQEGKAGFTTKMGYFRRLSSTSIAPLSPTPRLRKFPSLTETENEEKQ